MQRHLLFFLLLLAVIPASATIRYVDASVSNSGAGTSWATAYKTVQEGINACTAHGDEVWVKAGTYYPTEDPNGSASPTDSRDKTIYIKNYDIKLYGGFDGTETSSAQRVPQTNVTILSGDIDPTSTNDCYHVLLTINRGASCVTDGFTVQGGKANVGTTLTVSSPVAYVIRNSGGGMFNSVSNPTISNCIFSGDTASNQGGAIYNYYSSPVVHNCSFSSNMAYDGGGMYSTTGSPTVSNCSFSSNTATSYGGGIYNYNGSSTISYCSFTGNTGVGAAGGIYNSNGSPTISNCSFIGNTSSSYGGCMSNFYSSPTISNCVFSRNASSSGGGGAMSNSVSSPTVINCIFSGNTVTGDGGAMYNFYNSSPVISNCVFVNDTATSGGGAMYTYGSNASITNCTFYGNRATASGGNGGGLYYTNTSGGTITNCILWNNTTPNNSTDANLEEIYKESGGSTPLTASYSAIDDYLSTATNNYTSGSGIITNDPSFVGTADLDGPDNIWGTADDGLRIGCSGALKDAGTTGPANDMLGNPRIGNPDLGAYEAMATASASFSYIPALTTAVSLSQTSAGVDYSTCDTQVVKIDASSGTLSGSTIAKVYVQDVAPSFGGQPYVRRYYDITPASGANTATATITLFFTQADFDDYNSNKSVAYPSLPVDATDAAGNAANLRITQEHGTSRTGAPGSYQGWSGTGAAYVLITPATVSWNGTASRWEVTFPVTGFSGFFAHTTATNAPLPIGLLSFNAKLVSDNDVLLDWQVADAKDGKEYIVERSADGAAFYAIGSVAATSGSVYSLHDFAPLGGKSYYRLHLQDNNGKASYSNVQSIFVGTKSYVQVAPSPAHDFLVISTNAEGLSATLSDMQGRLRQSLAVSNGMKVDISALPPGINLLRMSSGEVLKIVKE